MSQSADVMGRYLGSLGDLRDRGASEDSICDLFLRFLRGAFPRLEHAEPIVLEEHIPALRVRGGFADALYADLIFEFKRRLDAVSRADGLEKLTRYLRNQEESERYLGLLTDGETLEVYAFKDERLAKVDQLRLAMESADEARVWLDCYLFHETQLTPTANDVALRFGERSPTFWHSLRILETLWRQVGREAGALTKFLEWHALLSIVYGSKVGYEGLFLRHTYLALFARVLAFVVLERRAPDAEQFPGILTGEAFQRMGFENFVEDDFFTWVGQQGANAAARALLHALATRLTAAYDLGAIGEDLLKELYQELVDPQARHDLGEFYTPDWLAELTLRKAGFPPGQSETADGALQTSGGTASLLDPACGSGTFLFTAVRLVREAGWKGRRLVEYCKQQLAGVDVHPLAVTIAKTNVLLALGDDLRGYRERFAVPVYMADSLSSADRGSTHPEVLVPVEVDEISQWSGKTRPNGLPRAFGVPAGLAAQPDALHAALDALLEFADCQISQAHAVQGFRERLRDLGVPAAQWHQWEANLDLLRWLMTSPTTNGVWRFILRNAYQPELLARRKFAFVVGNPPWLSYRSINGRAYQQRVRDLVFAFGLLGEREGHLFTHMELATLFFAFCADRYLADGGTLAFVMPRSILTGAKQHAAFRKSYVGACRLLIDCEQLTPLFNVPACVAICGQADLGRQPGVQPAQTPIPMLRLRGQLPFRNMSLAQAQEHWQTVETSLTPLQAEVRSPYWAQVIQGASIAPRCVWFVRPPESARVIDRRRPPLETDTATERQAKPPWKGIRLTGRVEAGFLFATLLSDNMLPFGWRRLSLLALPLACKRNQEPRLLSVEAAIQAGKAGLADWLRKAEATWAKHAKRGGGVDSVYDRLDYSHCLTRQRPTGVFKVLYNAAGTHVCACVVDATNVSRRHVHDLPVRGFIADYVTYWFETQNADEAHFLCAVLNAPLVDEAIKPYQTKGAFGAQRGKGERHIHRRPFEVLPIPLFDKTNARHRELARLSRQCHENVSAFLAGADEQWFTAPIGRLRTDVRADLLKSQLDQIDGLVSEILKRG